MYSSKIKEIWEKIHLTYNLANSKINSIKSKNSILNIPNLKENKDIFTKEEYQIISDFFIEKFQETSKIFSKFSREDFFSFIYLSEFQSYKTGDLIFSKEDDCNSYLFILNGDINLYSEKDISLKTNIDNGTISSGNIYGQLIKDKYKYYIRARNNLSIINILKQNFDELIISINRKIKTFKPLFIKKFFPGIRMFADDAINNILPNFERIKYQQYDKILLKQKYNEYIYLIISGEVGFCLKPKSIFNNPDNIFNVYDYILLEKMGRGDVFGINSALDGIKSLYNCIILTEEVELYRISKGDFLYYFNGRISDTALNLKSIGDLQNMSIQKKIEYLNNINLGDVNLINNIKNNFCIKIPDKDKIYFDKGFLIIYEDPVENVLYEKWKTIKLGLSDFKSKLLGQKKKRMDEIKKNIHDIDNNNENNKDRKDIAIIKKNQTYSLYRVANGRLNLKLNNNQIKSLNKLNGFCGIKNMDNNQIKDEKDKNNNSKFIELNEEKEN